jgi:hypothetical protein
MSARRPAESKASAGPLAVIGPNENLDGMRA